jgi:hypothetical protein
MQRKQMKTLRKYLLTLPYECRLLYFKFKQVKADADLLRLDVEDLIAARSS